MATSHESLGRRKIKKRKYSRKGCSECKRRKIKCDEGSPACFNCSRLKKNCTYPGSTPSEANTDDYLEEGKSQNPDKSLAKTGAAGHVTPGQGVPLAVKFYQPKTQESAVRCRNETPVKEESRAKSSSSELSAERSPTAEVKPELDMSNSQHNVEGMDEVLHFLPLEMRNFQNNVNVFLDDFYLNHAMEPMATDFGDSDIVLPPEIMAQSSGPEHSKAENLPGLPEFNIDDFMLTHGFDNTATATSVGAAAQTTNTNANSNNNDNNDNDNTINPNNTSGINEHLLLSSTQLTDSCVRENMLREPHVYYLRLLTDTDLAFHLFPFAASVEANGVLKLLLTYSVRCTYLLAALLAIAATFQFIRTSEKRHDQASQFYTEVCFKALTDVFKTQSYAEDNSAQFASSIEKLLLTVLIMSTRFTATTTVQALHTPSSWKDHLNGARDLLVEYSKMTRSSSLSSHSQQPYMSSGLALAKCWFFAIEASAAMHTAVGGALSRASAWDGVYDPSQMPDLYSYSPSVDLDSEYHIFVDTGCIDPHVHHEYHQALSRVQLVCDTDSGGVFNLYWGFSSSFLEPVLAFVSFTDAVKLRSLPHVPFKWTMHLLGLLDSSLRERVARDVCLHTFEIPFSSISHPDYKAKDRRPLPDSCYAVKTDANGARKVYSWFDASHQIHGDYLSLRVLVSQNFLGLPRSHPSVQYMIKKFFEGAFFIERKTSPQYEHDKPDIIIDSAHYYLSRRSFDIRCVMVQSMFRLVSGIVVDEDHFEKIELYFMGLLKLGNGSSLKSMDMVARIRSLRAENEAKLEGKMDEKIYDFYDSMNDIPFS